MMNNSTHFELYKLMVEMADRISERRLKTNQFYMSLISILLVVISLAFSTRTGNDNIWTISLTLFIVGILGVLICFIWQINIRSYRQLNSNKFIVINEMEKLLPEQPFTKEWELLGEGKDSKKYLQLTRIEKLVPNLMMIPCLILMVISGVELVYFYL